MRRPLVLLLAAILVGSLALVGCGGQAEETTTSVAAEVATTTSGATTTTQASAPDESMAVVTVDLNAEHSIDSLRGYVGEVVVVTRVVVAVQGTHPISELDPAPDGSEDILFYLYDEEHYDDDAMNPAERFRAVVPQDALAQFPYVQDIMDQGNGRHMRGGGAKVVGELYENSAGGLSILCEKKGQLFFREGDGWVG